MQAFDFITYVEYNNWANARLLDVAEKIPTDQLMSASGLSFNSAFDTLRHTLDVEWCYRLACIGQPATEELWKIEPLEDFPAVRAYWNAEGERLLELVKSLSPADFDKEVIPSWLTQAYSVGHLIIHLVNHGTNHRSELGWHFTKLGHSPGDMDFLDYLTKRRAAATE